MPKKIKKSKKRPSKEQMAAIKNAEKQFLEQRKAQKIYDNSFQMTVHKFNKFTCSKCDHDCEFAFIHMWEDPKTGQKYMLMRKACSTSCGDRDSLFEMNEIPKDGKEAAKTHIHDFPY